MGRVLTTAQARAFYDRLGARQDAQSFYEDRALQVLVDHGTFSTATSVFEFGCGTGRFAKRLLAQALAPEARYVGVDVSSTMVRLAREQLRHWPDRAQVRFSDGSTKLEVADNSFDRFVSTYVLDLLSEEDISCLLAEAARILTDDGLLCLASLTYGDKPLSKLVPWAWEQVHVLHPLLVGGCRPIRLLGFLPTNRWRVRHREVVSAFGVSSEVVIAARVATREPGLCQP